MRRGDFASASEAVRAALRLLQEQDRAGPGATGDPAWIRRSRAKIEEGWGQLRRVEGVPGPAALARVRREALEQPERRSRRRSA